MTSTKAAPAKKAPRKAASKTASKAQKPRKLSETAKSKRARDRFIRMHDGLWRAVESYAAHRNEPVSFVVRQSVIALLESESWPTEVSATAAKKLSRTKPVEDGRLINTNEVCAMLGVTRTTIYKFAKEGTLTPAEVPGAWGMRFLKAEVDALLAERETNPRLRSRK